MDTKRAHQVITGALMSDASLRMSKRSINALMQVNLSGWRHMDWIQEIGDALRTLGIVYRTDKRVGHSRGKDYELCHLLTRTHPLLTSLYHRWYAGGSKEFPEDLSLTPAATAHWFMGDGSSSFTRFYGVKVNIAVGSQHSVAIAMRELRRLGVENTQDSVQSGPFHCLGICSSREVTKFMKLIEPFILPSYEYKVKYPRLLKKDTDSILDSLKARLRCSGQLS